MNKIIRFAIFSPLLGILFYLLGYYAQKGELPTFKHQLSELLTSAMFAIIAGFGTLGISQILNKYRSWESKYVIRFWLQLLALFLMGLVISGIYLEIFILNSSSDLSYKQVWLIHQENFFKIALILFLLVTCYTLLDFIFYSYSHFREEEVKSIEMVNTQLELQFEALKSQLSPHFLFNSLNTISSLLYKNTHLAEHFIRRFAETYRFILEQNDNALIPLSKELNFVKDYNFILGIRFAQSFNLEIDVPKEVEESNVPPMSLQMLVENAVKHNLVSRTTPLKVTITYTDEKINVINNINPLRKQPNSFHIGIENIRKRYAYFTNKTIEINKKDNFTVSLPLIPA
jgi:sensor histidine kinase YesM